MSSLKEIYTCSTLAKSTGLFTKLKKKIQIIIQAVGVALISVSIASGVFFSSRERIDNFYNTLHISPEKNLSALFSS